MSRPFLFALIPFMTWNETPGTNSLIMDRSEPIGNSEDNQLRRALHTKVTNKPSEAIPFTFASADTPIITNFSIPLINTEYQFNFQFNTKKFIIRSRNPARLQFAFVSGDSSINYFTIPVGCSFSEEGVQLQSKSLFVQSSSVTMLEILEWI